MEDWIGSLAGFCTTVAFVPQAIKVVRDKDTAAISLWMYIIFSLGVTLWLTYGLLINNLPIIVSNVFVVPLAYAILFMKIRHG